MRAIRITDMPPAPPYSHVLNEAAKRGILLLGENATDHNGVIIVGLCDYLHDMNKHALELERRIENLEAGL